MKVGVRVKHLEQSLVPEMLTVSAPQLLLWESSLPWEGHRAGILGPQSRAPFHSSFPPRWSWWPG